MIYHVGLILLALLIERFGDREGGEDRRNCDIDLPNDIRLKNSMRLGPNPLTEFRAKCLPGQILDSVSG